MMWPMSLKMCRNLILLSQLDSKGYSYSLVSGVLKVPYHSTILMKGEKYDGLYYFIRKIMTLKNGLE
jgi:hypothetical protein